MKSRVLILIVAIVLGVAAAIVAGNYLNDASARLTAEAETVQVLVATQDVPQGMTADEILQEGYVELREVPRRYVADGAVSSLSAISGQVLSTTLSAGEQVTSARFKYASEVGLSYSIPDGFVAMSIAADDVKCVGGMLKPGDYVMVAATLDPGPEGEGAETRILLVKVKVLAVGDVISGDTVTATDAENRNTLTSNTSSNESKQSLTVTLALLPSDVEKLVFAEEQGTVRLALLSATATDTATTSGRTLTNIFE